MSNWYLSSDGQRKPLREPVPGMIIAGWLCCDCCSCTTRGRCRRLKRYVGKWTRACSDARIQPERLKAIAELAGASDG